MVVLGDRSRALSCVSVCSWVGVTVEPRGERGAAARWGLVRFGGDAVGRLAEGW